MNTLHLLMSRVKGTIEHLSVGIMAAFVVVLTVKPKIAI